MTIVSPSLGYPGAIAPGTAWANMQKGLGALYWCEDFGAARVTPLSGGTRQVQVGAGWFGGQGIVDYNDAPVTVTLPSVSGNRWFLIVARRTWQTTNATSFTYIDCGTSPVYPPELNKDPGVIDDQPLAFVPLSAGSTVPGTPRDVRVMGSSPASMIIVDELALGYNANLGTRLRLGNREYVRGLTASGTPTWLVDNGPFGRNPITVYPSGWGSSRSGWTTSQLVSRAIRDGNTVQIDLRIRRVGSNIPVGSAGGVTDVPMFDVVSELRPSNTLYTACSYINQDNSNSDGLVSLDTSGTIWFSAGTPNRNLRQMPAGSWSLSATFVYIQTGV